ncbi:hypothetical protein PCE1_003234 [Barthelona sp. PCE]
MLVSGAALFKAAKAGKFGIGGFNINNLENVQAIVAAAAEVNAPVIFQASKGAIAYSDIRYLSSMMTACSELHPEIPIALHLDHGNIATCNLILDKYEALVNAGVSLDDAVKEVGFTSLMIDLSHEDLEVNISETKKIVDRAHLYGISVEAEIGVLAGVEEDVTAEKSNYTDPVEAVRICTESNLDALAISCGTEHGAYKSIAGNKDGLQYDLIQEISNVTNKPLVLHGASSVPPELVKLCNDHGADLKNAGGTPMEGIVEAVTRGIAKINVDSDFRLGVCGTIRKYMAEHPAVFDPRKFLGAARDFQKELVKEKMIAFGQAGKICPEMFVTLSQQAEIYANEQ